MLVSARHLFQTETSTIKTKTSKRDSDRSFSGRCLVYTCAGFAVSQDEHPGESGQLLRAAKEPLRVIKEGASRLFLKIVFLN